MRYARLFTLPMTEFHRPEDEPSFTDVYNLLLYALERADCCAVAQGCEEDDPFTERDYLFYVEYFTSLIGVGGEEYIHALPEGDYQSPRKRHSVTPRFSIPNDIDKVVVAQGLSKHNIWEWTVALFGNCYPLLLPANLPESDMRKMIDEGCFFDCDDIKRLLNLDIHMDFALFPMVEIPKPKFRKICETHTILLTDNQEIARHLTDLCRQMKMTPHGDIDF